MSNPFVSAGARLRAAFSPDAYKGDFRAQIGGEIDGGKQGFTNDRFLDNWKRLKNRKTLCASFLVLNGTAYNDIRITVLPIVGYTFVKTVYPFGYDHEPDIRTQTDHIP